MKKFFCWLLVIVWLLVIFWFSAQNGVNTTAQSRGFARIMIEEISKLKVKAGISSEVISDEDASSMAREINPIIRKVAHVFIYTMLAIFIIIALGNNNKKFLRNAWIAIIICAAYSVFDEYHQTFIDARNGTANDCAIDIVGAILGTQIYRLFLNFKNKIKKHQK